MYKNILLATDLSEENAHIVTKTQWIQQQSGAQLNVVHVVEPLPGYSYAYFGIGDVEARLVHEAKAALAKVGDLLQVASERQFVVIGPTKIQILHLAHTIAADLIICGSHGKHGLSLLLGSTANAVLHGAQCDVLTIRLPDHEL